MVYNEILSELKDKSSDKFKELKTKYDKELIDFFAKFDSEKFDIDFINKTISKYLKNKNEYFGQFKPNF